MITHYSASRILSALCGRSQSATLAATAYVALSTTTPTAAGENFTEPSGNGYARVMIGNYGQVLTQKMGNPDEGETTNSEIIYFPEATGSWGTCTYFGIYSALTGGSLLAYGQLTTPITPTNNTVPLVRIGELSISIE